MTNSVAVDEQSAHPPKRRADKRRAERQAESGVSGGARRKPSLFSRILGVLGELLITIGVILALYVVWQVWWTSVEAKAETDAALDSIAEQMPEANLEVATEVFGPDVAPPLVGINNVGAIGVLHVPVWGEDYAAPILEGTSEAVLGTGGAGHYEGTALPGELGNSSLAGHRLTRGNPFLHVDKLKIGDAVVVETAEAWLVYTVESDQIVDPSAVEVIAPVPGQPGVAPTRRMLTLTTCHPVTSRSHRWITHLTLSHWTARDGGLPPELAAMAQAATITQNRVGSTGGN